MCCLQNVSIKWKFRTIFHEEAVKTSLTNRVIVPLIQVAAVFSVQNLIGVVILPVLCIVTLESSSLDYNVTINYLSSL